MRRGPAIGVLALFGLGALVVGYWGLTDVLSARQAMAECRPSVSFDTSSLWFLGCAAIALLPFLALAPDRAHSALFAFLIAGFFVLPGLGHGWLNNAAQTSGYTGMPPLFSLQSTELVSSAQCQSQPTGVA